MEASALPAPAAVTRTRPSLGSHRPPALLRLRSDEQLVALFRAGHDDAFRVIHDRYRQRLFAYTRQMLPHRQDAEDALQDIFVRAYAGLRANRPRARAAGLALPGGAQPLHRRAAPPGAAAARGDAAAARAGARPDRRGRPARVAPAADRGRSPAPRSAALGAAHARARRDVLRRPGRRARGHGPGREVAARAGAARPSPRRSRRATPRARRSARS